MCVWGEIDGRGAGRVREPSEGRSGRGGEYKTGQRKRGRGRETKRERDGSGRREKREPGHKERERRRGLSANSPLPKKKTFTLASCLSYPPYPTPHYSPHSYPLWSVGNYPLARAKHMWTSHRLARSRPSKEKFIDLKAVRAHGA
jgi:hypothetical protein